MQGLNQALEAAQAFRGAAQTALAERLAARHYDAEQRAAHGFAWIATSVAALEAVLGWTDAGNGANPLDDVVARLAFVEIIGQLSGGLPMGQNELLRPSDLHISAAGRALTDACAELLEADLTAVRADLIAALAQGRWPSETLHDAELDAIREQFRRFTDAKIIPNAHKWHLANDLIPDQRFRRWRTWALSAFAYRSSSAASVSTSWSCALSPRNCRAGGLGQVRSARDRKLQAS